MLTLLMTILLLLGTNPVSAGETTPVVIDHQEMQQILDDFLAEQSALLPQVELRLTEVKFPAPYTVPTGRIEHQLIPSRPGVLGSRRISIMTRVDDQIVSNQSIRIEIEAMAEIAVAKEGLRRGTLLTESQIEMRYQDISRLSEPIFNSADAVGKIVKRSVRLGEPLQGQQVEYPPLVKRGERVVIEVQHAGMTLSAVGEARQDGREGESIKVVNIGSSREVISQVVAPGLVRVEL
jgi:flagella basal body P-ring formation protein FlgA